MVEMKSIWIPPQQESLRRYLRWTTVTAFVIVMLAVISMFVDEFVQSNRHQAQAKSEIARLEQAARAARAAHEQQQAQAARQRSDRPQGSAPPPPPPEIKVEAGPSHIEIDAKLLRVVMDNEASWMAIMKIVVTILATFFGIRLINFVFARLDPDVKSKMS